jgi:hypothetical protein
MSHTDDHDADACEAIGETLERVAPAPVVVHRRRATGWGAVCGCYTGQIDDYARPTCPECKAAVAARRGR